MTDQSPAPLPRMRPRRVLIIALFSAAVALALTLVLGNFMPAQATQCDPQVVRGQKIDSSAFGQLAALNGTGEGRGYADLSFADASGRPMTLADFKGKKLLVNFWASWCIPCRAEMPALAAIAAKYNSDQFAMVPINFDVGADGLQKAEKFLADNKIEGVPLYQAPITAFQRLQQQAVALGLPTTLLLDEKGCELAVLQGPAEWDSADGHAVIDTLIGS